jgi:hypothetical protein
MTTTIVNMDPYEFRITYPEGTAFIYSPLPILVECDEMKNNPSVAFRVSATVTNLESGKSFSVLREINKGRAYFNINRICQLLRADIDGALDEFGLIKTSRQAPTLATPYNVSLSIQNSARLSFSIYGMPGTINPTESYGDHKSLRVFTNYPQTIEVWGNNGAIQIGNEKVPLTKYALGDLTGCRHMYLPYALAGTEALEKLREDKTQQASVTWQEVFKYGQSYRVESRALTLNPDNRPRGCGVYLRWLNRRGGVSYWLFDKTEKETSAKIEQSFYHMYTSDLQGADILNAQKREYSAQQILGIRASSLSAEEYDDLLDLLYSPVVHMLFEPEEYQNLGSVGSEPIVAGPTIEQPELWVRVNPDGGTGARNLYRGTPRLHTFEATITLLPLDIPML